MCRNAGLRMLREHLTVLRHRFGVLEIAAFGSTAPDEALDRSDIDVLVTGG